MSRPLRAAGPHVYPLRAESDIGGEVYERELLERLPAHGIALRLGLPRDHAAGELVSVAEIDVLRHRTRRHWVTAPAVFVPWVLGLLRRGEVDVLRAHSVRHVAPSLLLARQLARSRVPVVVHHHHFTERWRDLEGAILRRADAVVTVSEHSAAALRAAGVASGRIHVAFDGVAGPPATEGLAAAWPAPGLRLLHLGRLEDRKRPGLAVATLARLRDAGVAASLVLAGDGPQRAELKTAAGRAGLDGVIRLLGRVSDADKWRLLDSADALLFGSTLEGFGLVVAEAQSRGVPVIAAAGTASAEALVPGESGLLAAPDPDAFASAVQAVCQPERRSAMSRAARAHAARFTWEACARDVAAVMRATVDVAS